MQILVSAAGNLDHQHDSPTTVFNSNLKMKIRQALFVLGKDKVLSIQGQNSKCQKVKKLLAGNEDKAVVRILPLGSCLGTKFKKFSNWDSFFLINFSQLR